MSIEHTTIKLAGRLLSHPRRDRTKARCFCKFFLRFFTKFLLPASKPSPEGEGPGPRPQNEYPRDAEAEMNLLSPLRRPRKLPVISK
jgi:hypothetical protein